MMTRSALNSKRLEEHSKKKCNKKNENRNKSFYLTGARDSTDVLQSFLSMCKNVSYLSFVGLGIENNVEEYKMTEMVGCLLV